VSIVYPHQSVREAFRHQLRWNLSVRFSRPAGHLGLLFTQSLPLALVAGLFAPSRGVAAAFLGTYVVLRFALAWFVGIDGMRDDLVGRNLWMLPLRDAFAFLVWVASFFPQTIMWRGKRFRVRDKRLIPA
jgi:ceramide glucosyltransferase